MSQSIRIGIVQLNPTVGDVSGNRKQIAAAYTDAVDAGADLVVTPELSLLGYPPRDLLHHTDLLTAAENALTTLATQTQDSPPLVVGTATEASGTHGPQLYNSAILLRDGQQADTYTKRLLPTYDVFDEARYFRAGAEPVIISVDGVRVGLTICEDAWHDVVVAGRHQHDTNPLAETADRGADVIVTLSASPFSIDKPTRRTHRFIAHARATDCPVLFVNQVGGNDELIFDGHSLVAADGQLAAQLPGFTSATTVISLPTETSAAMPTQSQAEQARAALSLGLSDYFSKTGFERAVIGLSGGIDSSVVAALAVQAPQIAHVYGVSLPSAVTSQQSIADARSVATNLGLAFDVIPIADAVQAIQSHLATHATAPTGVTLENLQARVRGDFLMSLANELNALVLTPDNKSEGAVGYCTLYGDTVGGLAPLGDCYKHLVYQIAASINDDPPEAATAPSPIPQSVIEKAPTAELREAQADTDELPPYDALDPVLRDYIEQGVAYGMLVDQHGKQAVNQSIPRVTRSEFKRRQTPPPLRITQKALGRGWQYPIAAAYDCIHPPDA